MSKLKAKTFYNHDYLQVASHAKLYSAYFTNAWFIILKFGKVQALLGMKLEGSFPSIKLGYINFIIPFSYRCLASEKHLGTIHVSNILC